MKKNHLLFLLFTLTCFGTRVFGQSTPLPCYTDEVRKRAVAAHPEILAYEAEFNRQVADGIKKLDLSKLARTTDSAGSDTFWYDIPIVVHVIHDYNNTTDYLSDNAIYNDLVDWNIVYAGANYDTATVIQPFKKYIGIPRIRLHLATKDPNGNPTHGITRHRSYLTYIGGDESKLDDWPPTSYVNIWTVNIMSLANAFAAAYAYQPATAAFLPQEDGVICLWNYLNNDYSAVSKTINHEIGHVFNLEHPWGNTNSPEIACGDDLVDDTPPTHGHSPTRITCNVDTLNDTECASNYFKIYPSSVPGVDSLVDYPDTTNAQNIMDYTYCSRMFTKGQVVRMHAALNSSVAGRSNLFSATNLQYTGVVSGTDAAGRYIFTPRLDLKPIPEFNVSYSAGSSDVTDYMDKLGYFIFPGKRVSFSNETWNDTLTSLVWTFSNGALYPTISSISSVPPPFFNMFSQPGWVNISMKATGNNTGDSTVTWPHTVFVADTVGTPGDGYFMEFNNSDTARWPTFNYYNNEFKWQIANLGYDDNSCIQFTGYDNRVIISPTTFYYPPTGNPTGDVDDLFSIPMDLSTFTDTCNLNFYYSGASRSSTSTDINDTLEIDYSVNKSTNWTPLKYLSKKSLENKGALSIPYAPLWQGDWAPKTIGIPPSARSNYVTFRFRYRAGVTAPNPYGVNFSSGNNFYMDRINFSRLPASVSSVKLANLDVVLVPNPTNGDAYVVIKDVANATAEIVVSDITGKTVYTTSQQVNGEARVQIPHAVISVKGVYMVRTITGSQMRTQKLVVE